VTTEYSDHAAFVHDIAPYLLGALDHDEMRAFEAHLRICDQCSDALVGTSPLADHLSRLDEAAFAPPLPPPDTLLARLLREVDHDRRAAARRSRLVLTVAASIVALLTAIATTLVVNHAGHHSSTTLALSPVSAKVPVHASIRLTAAGSATGLDLNCTYDASTSYREHEYYLVVTNREGLKATVSTWTIGNGQSLQLHALSPWTRSQMSRIALQTVDGRDILAVNL